MKVTPEIAALIAKEANNVIAILKSVVNVITQIHTMDTPALKVPHLDIR